MEGIRRFKNISEEEYIIYKRSKNIIDKLIIFLKYSFH